LPFENQDGPENKKNLNPKLSRPSIILIAPFVTIIGVDCTFLAVRAADLTDHVVFQLLSTMLPNDYIEVTSKYLLEESLI